MLTKRWGIYGDSVRFLIFLKSLDDKKMPINYQHGLSSLVYRFIKEADDNLSSSLHHSRGFKQFTFSRLDSETKEIHGHEILFPKDSVVKFNLSSPNSEILRSAVEGMFIMKKVELLGKKFEVLTPRYLETPSFSTTATFSTLSPIHIDIVRENGERWDLVPTDPEWKQRIEENSRKKYFQYFQREYKGPFEIEEIHWMKTKRITIRDSKWRAANMKFTMKAEPDMLRFLWDAGIGSKNSQGFGCLRYVEKEREMAKGKPFNTESHGYP